MFTYIVKVNENIEGTNVIWVKQTVTTKNRDEAIKFAVIEQNKVRKKRGFPKLTKATKLRIKFSVNKIPSEDKRRRKF